MPPDDSDSVCEKPPTVKEKSEVSIETVLDSPTPNRQREFGLINFQTPNSHRAIPSEGDHLWSEEEEAGELINAIVEVNDSALQGQGDQWNQKSRPMTDSPFHDPKWSSLSTGELTDLSHHWKHKASLETVLDSQSPNRQREFGLIPFQTQEHRRAEVDRQWRSGGQGELTDLEIKANENALDAFGVHWHPEFKSRSCSEKRVPNWSPSSAGELMVLSHHWAIGNKPEEKLIDIGDRDEKLIEIDDENNWNVLTFSANPQICLDAGTASRGDVSDVMRS